MAPRRSDRLLNATGLLTWLAAGVPELLRLASAPALLREPATLGLLTAFLLFGALYAHNTRRPGALPVPGFLAQTLCALALCALGHSGFEPALLGITAGMAPALGSPRRAGAWVAAQSAALLALLLLGLPPLRALVTAGLYTGLQLFAFGVASLAEREAKARAELAEANAALQAAQALLAGREREAERLRIARELHDSVGHHLTALSLNLEAAGHTVQGPGRDHVERAQGVTRQLLADVRGVVSALREPPPSALAPALRALVAEAPGLAVHLEVPESLALATPEAALSLFRCVQELLTNTLRHAAARNLWIDIQRGPGGLQVHARDDGRGAAAGRVLPGAGLRGMQERFRALGGGVEVRGEAGQGLEVRAWLPEGA
ncbi:MULTISPECIES: sensor histidine kinase [Myxococcaceae]|uniref:sensor histidine kinase n=1 Tax=Myxococcaceae TaxID=31 RepID=UPI001E4CE7BD|nr:MULTISPECIES: sensor histidine kinase [Myxococcaceae]